MMYLDAEDREELREEPGVHVPAHLVEDEPVADGAVLGVVLDVPHVVVGLEVAVYAHAHDVVARSVRAELDDAIDEAEAREDREEKVPEPQDQEDLKKRVVNNTFFSKFYRKEQVRHF